MVEPREWAEEAVLLRELLAVGNGLVGLVVTPVVIKAPVLGGAMLSVTVVREACVGI